MGPFPKLIIKKGYAYNRKNFHYDNRNGTEKLYAYKRNMLITGMLISDKALP
jgi:hypothetical protein